MNGIGNVPETRVEDMILIERRDMLEKRIAEYLEG